MCQLLALTLCLAVVFLTTPASQGHKPLGVAADAVKAAISRCIVGRPRTSEQYAYDETHFGKRRPPFP